MLVISCLVLGAALVLEVRPDSRVRVTGAPNALLPPLCLSREWFGVSCPGCGLTRSFVHLAHGDWSAAWRSHRLGWLLAGALLLQIPYRIHALRNPGRPLLSGRVSRRFGQCLIGLLALNWLLGLLLSP
jgi:hypothetical protein